MSLCSAVFLTPAYRPRKHTPNVSGDRPPITTMNQCTSILPRCTWEPTSCLTFLLGVHIEGVLGMRFVRPV